MPTTTRKLATRHRCANRVALQCARGSGRGPRKCGACGSSVIAERGLYGVFVWRGDGRYPEADAISTHGTESAADKVTETDPRYVVRWLHYGYA